MEKELGFGFRRLPVLDENDLKSIDYDTLTEMVDYFMKSGFNTFDTAYVYHEGESEIALRKTVVERYPRDSFVIASKVTPDLLHTKDDLPRLFDDSMSKLGIDYFDHFLIHNISQPQYNAAVKFDYFDFVREKKKEGKIVEVGMSFHGTPDLLEEVLSKYADRLDFIQLQINNVDWEDPNFQARRQYEIARKYGLPVSVMEPNKGGMLAHPPQEALDLMNKQAPGLSPVAWNLRYAASLEGVQWVQTGMNCMEHLVENVATMKDFKPLSAEEHAVMEEVVKIYEKNQKGYPCTFCRYCLDDCPKDIPIPNYIYLYNSGKENIKYLNNEYLPTEVVNYISLMSEHGRAKDCIGCRLCERTCPQHLPIVDIMDKVARFYDDMLDSYDTETGEKIGEWQPPVD